ncbi:MAG: Flp pilus assembly protein CpaB [Actinomycetota bacterium]
MGNRRTLLGAAAVLLAVVAGLGVYSYAAKAEDRAQRQVQTVQAFVAVRDIPKGTTGADALAQGMVQASRTLRGSVPPAAVTDSRTLAGKVAAATIQARQFVTDASFVAPSEAGGGTLAAAIGGKELVAVTVSFDAARAVANQIAPGDRVDLIAGSDQSRYLYRGVKVLSIGQETAATAGGGNGQPSENASATGLITFEVTPEQALAIVNASRDGGIYLTLQSLSAADATTAAATGTGR